MSLAVEQLLMSREQWADEVALHEARLEIAQECLNRAEALVDEERQEICGAMAGEALCHVRDALWAILEGVPLSEDQYEVVDDLRDFVLEEGERWMKRKAHHLYMETDWDCC